MQTLAERLIYLELSTNVRPYAAIQDISECFKILQQGIIYKNNREAINKIKIALEQLERMWQTNVINFSQVDHKKWPLRPYKRFTKSSSKICIKIIS